MADVLQTEIVEPEFIPLDTLADPARQTTGIPSACVVHRGNISVDAIGVGDTGRLRVVLRIPVARFLRMTGFVMSIDDDADILWEQGHIECFYAPQISPVFGGGSTTVYFPLQGSDTIDHQHNRFKYFAFGLNGVNTTRSITAIANDLTSIDRFFFTGIQDSPNTAPTIEIRNTQASQPTCQLRFAITWLAFNTEQHASAALTMPLLY